MSKVVLLISDKRSGSTMFQRELCRHPLIAHVAYSPHTYFETHHWLKGAVMLGAPAEHFAGGKTYQGYGSAANARTYLLDCVRGNVPGYVVRHSGKELVFDAWEALCNRYAQPVFFEKSPQHIANWASLSLLLEWMGQTRHEVKIIGLTRNPMAVLYSAQALFHTSPASRQYAWVELQRNLLALAEKIPASSYLHCRYEDLIANPAQELGRVCAFIGVPPHPQTGSAIHRESLQQWRGDPEFDFQLDPAVVQFAQQFGYTETDLSNAGKPGVPLWKKRYRQTAGACKLLAARSHDRYLKPLILRLKRHRS